MKKLLKKLANKVMYEGFKAFEYRDAYGVKTFEIIEYTNKINGKKHFEAVEIATGKSSKFIDIEYARCYAMNNTQCTL